MLRTTCSGEATAAAVAGSAWSAGAGSSNDDDVTLIDVYDLQTNNFGEYLVQGWTTVRIRYYDTLSYNMKVA